MPNIGNKEIKRYGKMDRNKEGSKTPINTSAQNHVTFLFL
jgi:hypothetical protein